MQPSCPNDCLTHQGPGLGSTKSSFDWQRPQGGTMWAVAVSTTMDAMLSMTSQGIGH